MMMNGVGRPELIAALVKVTWVIVVMTPLAGLELRDNGVPLIGSDFAGSIYHADIGITGTRCYIIHSRQCISGIPYWMAAGPTSSLPPCNEKCMKGQNWRRVPGCDFWTTV